MERERERERETEKEGGYKDEAIVSQSTHIKRTYFNVRVVRNVTAVEEIRQERK